MGSLEKAAKFISLYLLEYSDPDEEILKRELNRILGAPLPHPSEKEGISYRALQDALGKLNEREPGRKLKGVYYTPLDVVQFIIANVVNLSRYQAKEDELTLPARIEGCEGLIDKTVLDPTCGAGEFLLEFLNIKLSHIDEKNFCIVRAALASIYGNDLNAESTAIAKIRLLLCVFDRFGGKCVEGLSNILDEHFTNVDFLDTGSNFGQKFDFIIGNPPYVEDKKFGGCYKEQYGNVYCNVLANSLKLLKKGAALGFVVPLSYISTPRMFKIRELMREVLSTQIVLSYADRPDCLFPSVHQKLCIVCGREGTGGEIYTGGYKYWYKQEREKLFLNTAAYKNPFYGEKCVPKLQSELEKSIYNKILSQKSPLLEKMAGGEYPISLNMRAYFWIKAFLSPHQSAEYATFYCKTETEREYVSALLNSSLFWWYWVCVSDCWHITRKELLGFFVPPMPEDRRLGELARALEDRLEETKQFVGTKQVEYEYKHRECLKEIEELDRAINQLYSLSEEESEYIIGFSKRYRIGGGAKSCQEG